MILSILRSENHTQTNITQLLKFYAQKYGARYIGYCNSPPEASKDTLMPSIEKLLVATAPLQTLAMSARRVYRWENRSETLAYLVIYLVLWSFDIAVSGCVSNKLSLDERISANMKVACSYYFSCDTTTPESSIH